MSLSVHLGELGSIGSCVYRRNDMTLEYVIGPGNEVAGLPTHKTELELGISRRRNALFIAGTLTLVFSGDPRKMIGFDAYTNSELWIRKERMPLPRSDGIGELRLTDLPDGEDRMSIDVEPRFEYCEETNLLRILLGHGNALVHYTICANVIAGISSQRLEELYLLDMRQVP